MRNLDVNHLAKKRSKTKGFTLIELMVTVTVFSILVVIAAPSMSGVVQNNRLSVTNNDLVGALSFTRSEAVKRQQTVTICGSTNSTSCDDISWRKGWIVFTDANGNATIDGSDTYLLVHGDANAGVTITSQSISYKFSQNGQITASCTDCENDLIQKGNMLALMPTMLEKVVMSLLPISTAQASPSGASHSGGSGHTTLPTCTAPAGGGSGASGSGSSGSGHSGHASGAAHDAEDSHAAHDANSSHDSGASHSSDDTDDTHVATSSTTATCTGGGLSGPIGTNQMLICDSGRSGEKGSLITVSKVGRITRQSVTCD